MRNALGVLFQILMILSFLFGPILLIVMPTEPIWIIFLGIGVLLGFIFFIFGLCFEDEDEDDDYGCAFDDGWGYDEGKKETTNEEKKQFIVKLKTTCPHCGAPMKNDTCDYCGCKSEIYKVIQ